MEISKSNKTAIVIGADSLVGRNVLFLLLQEEAYHQVIAFSDEHPGYEDKKLIWFSFQREGANRLMPQIKGDDLFWCRSSFIDWTNITDMASIREALPFQIALEALKNQASQMIFLSSGLIQKNAWLPIIKERAMLEKAIVQLPFWATHIFKPYAILHRSPLSKLSNRLAAGLSEWIGGGVESYRPMDAQEVAEAMVEAAQQIKQGVHYHYAKQMQN